MRNGEDVIMCVVCGFPESVCQLIRITWDDTSTENEFSALLKVAEKPKSNDVLVCLECIKGIKRIPFSELPDRINKL